MARHLDDLQDCLWESDLTVAGQKPRKMGTVPCQGDPAGLSGLALHILVRLRMGAHSGGLSLQV